MEPEVLRLADLPDCVLISILGAAYASGGPRWLEYGGRNPLRVTVPLVSRR